MIIFWYIFALFWFVVSVLGLHETEFAFIMMILGMIMHKLYTMEEK